MSTDATVALLLSLADDELILGHRLSEWTGWVPYIEEDLALSSIAQDEMAHARALYAIVSDMDGRDVDSLALGRRPEDYRNAVLCERPNRDYAHTIARHLLYDTADDVRLDALESSSCVPLREAVAVFRLEERYHLEHAYAWFTRIADGPVDARRRLADALASTLPEAIAVFEPLPDEDALVADGVLPRSSEDLLATWLERMGATLDAVGLEHVLSGGDAGTTGAMIPTSSGEMQAGDATDEPLRPPGVTRDGGRWSHAGGFEGAGGRYGKHSEDFLPLWEEMTALYRAHPGARW